MATLMNPTAAARLERSCGPTPGDWVRLAPSADGLERAEAGFAGHAFDKHRHDTYAIGYTAAGVQSFTYRGTVEHSLPGQVFALHPDETHDGRAATAEGFRYRILYLEPRLIREALAGDALPFVRAAVSRDRRLSLAVGRALDDIDQPLGELQRDQIVLDLAEALAALDPSARVPTCSGHHALAVRRAREYLDANAADAVRSAALEAATGLGRYALARYFRAAYGTSPHRYLTMRRLDRVRRSILRGARLADAALSAGFADQSHMTRHFKRAYGLSPGRWAAMIRSVAPAGS